MIPVAGYVRSPSSTCGRSCARVFVGQGDAADNHAGHHQKASPEQPEHDDKLIASQAKQPDVDVVDVDQHYRWDGISAEMTSPLGRVGVPCPPSHRRQDMRDRKMVG